MPPGINQLKATKTMASNASLISLIAPPQNHPWTCLVPFLDLPICVVHNKKTVFFREMALPYKENHKI